MVAKDFFKRVCCVSLGRRNDRWQQFTKDLPGDWPFKRPEKIKAIDGKLVRPPEWWKQGGPAWGCYRSHLRLIEQAMNDGVESILLMEDDALCIPDFTSKVESFLNEIPENWDMIYLGGQHLYIGKNPPKRISDWVYQPYNVNRTHAFALRGHMLSVVYKHLCRTDWNNGHHIDHHLGRLCQNRQHKIYSPKEWLIGQAAGKSNISGKSPPDRFWKNAGDIKQVHHKSPTPIVIPPKEVIAKPTKPILQDNFVIVMGLHSSGSSCLAGVLHHLGIYLGKNLTGFYGNNPDKSCGFEAQGLMALCEAAIPFPSVNYKWPPHKIYTLLKKWILHKQKEAKELKTIAGAKYPLLCRMHNQIANICQDKLKLIHISRPIESSIKSLVARSGSKYPSETLEAHQRWLEEGKQQLLLKYPDHLTIEYDSLLEKPQVAIKSICSYLEYTATKAAIKKAVAYVKPEQKHH